ncbi:hypothetical protein [Kribbella sp. HUAS MG21]|uniref:PE family protein n=1 Tax=Kribbella sp. HUAS MG21 TaxID=3160966 RepID=A0AAU7TIR8_9ACTN
MSEAPRPISFGGAGDVDMYPAETNAAVAGIADAGKVIGAAWAAAAPAIAADEAVVGTGLDELSAGFRERYNRIKPQLEKVAQEAEHNFQAMGANGNKIVLLYMELTRQQADRLRRLE